MAGRALRGDAELRTAYVLAIGPAAVFLGIAGLALGAGDRSGASAPCRGPEPRDLPGETVELAAGDRVWSAWITYPPVSGETVTVLWRAAGFVPGDLHVTGADAAGHRLAVEFGPSPVLPQLRGGGLQWPREGREWGSRIFFPHPGCWRLEVDAGGRPGELSVWVEE
jgi:hypothetical protein